MWCGHWGFPWLLETQTGPHPWTNLFSHMLGWGVCDSSLPCHRLFCSWVWIRSRGAAEICFEGFYCSDECRTLMSRQLNGFPEADPVRRRAENQTLRLCSRPQPEHVAVWRKNPKMACIILPDSNPTRSCVRNISKQDVSRCDSLVLTG